MRKPKTDEQMNDDVTFEYSPYINLRKSICLIENNTVLTCIQFVFFFFRRAAEFTYALNNVIIISARSWNWVRAESENFQVKYISFKTPEIISEALTYSFLLHPKFIYENLVISIW